MAFFRPLHAVRFRSQPSRPGLYARRSHSAAPLPLQSLPSDLRSLPSSYQLPLSRYVGYVFPSSPFFPAHWTECGARPAPSRVYTPPHSPCVVLRFPSHRYPPAAIRQFAVTSSTILSFVAPLALSGSCGSFLPPSLGAPPALNPGLCSV